MRKSAWITSVVGHVMVVILGIGMQWYRHGSSMVPMTPPAMTCTIPIEITASAPISTAPISRPKEEKLKRQEEDRIVTPAPLPDEPIKDVDWDAVNAKQAAEKDSAPKIEPDTADLVKSQAIMPAPSVVPTAPKSSPSAPIHNAGASLAQPAKPKPKAKMPLIKNQHAKKAKNSHRLVNQALERALKRLPKRADQERLAGKRNQDFIDVLNDVDKDAKISGQSQTPVTDPNSTSTYGADAIGPELAISDIDRLRMVLYKAWQMPMRASENGGLRVYVVITMNPDATIGTVQIVHHKGTRTHPAYDLGVQSVQQALAHFKKNPLPLKPDMYEAWKEFEFIFQAR